MRRGIEEPGLREKYHWGLARASEVEIGGKDTPLNSEELIPSFSRTVPAAVPVEEHMQKPCVMQFVLHD